MLVKPDDLTPGLQVELHQEITCLEQGSQPLQLQAQGCGALTAMPRANPKQHAAATTPAIVVSNKEDKRPYRGHQDSVDLSAGPIAPGLDKTAVTEIELA